MLGPNARVRVRPQASSEEGRLHRGEYGRVKGFKRAMETMALEYYEVRLDDGTMVKLHPEELEPSY